MPLTIGFDPSGLPGAVVSALDDIIAPLQTWAGAIDGINAEERLNALTTGVASLSTVPTGMIAPWAVAAAPSGWLLCDGNAYSRTTYTTLFSLIGVTYGAGNGSTTFNVPDLRGRFPLGVAGAGTGGTLASTGGSLDHTHSVPAIAAHTHTVSGSTANESSHTHTFTTNTPTATAGTPAPGPGSGVDSTHVHTGTTNSGSAHSHGAGTLAADSSGGSGAGTSGSANPAFLAIHFVIKT